ncbi:ABC transporter substrate-binding protein [Natrinema salifodinae]|uniref:Spermidine/putrescine transport system substrate-binding protein n=1 Tax=Natrinema salifodinae TaxID=1202768 RepID=A0A1I0MAD6_9EURY|nr:extracellular solute-binding protein [Natrinema salifodinae]SEV84686.1 spermidine/putrescine transport system substrate-binding protein [Natrinema salifodinae]
MAADPERVAESSNCESEAASSETAQASVSRRRMLSATAVGSATALAGCTKLLSGSSDALRVCVWSGNYADRFEDAVVPKYEEEFDADIQLQRGWDEILADIRSAPDDNPPYDVTVTEGNFYYYGRQEELFHEIREENVPNLEEVIDYYTEFRTTEYGMPVDGAPCTIVHREDADVQPDSWSDFSSEAVQNSAGVGVDTGFWWYPLYAAAVGMDERELGDEMHEPDLHEAVLETFRDWPVSGWASSGEDVWQQFDNGVIDAAQWYYEQVAYDIDDYDGLTHTMPEETTGYLNHWCVVDGTDKRDQAEEFINFLMDAETQTAWSEEMPTLFCNENTEYAEDLAEDLPSNSEEAANIAFPDWEVLAEHDDELSDEFTAIQTDS